MTERLITLAPTFPRAHVGPLLGRFLCRQEHPDAPRCTTCLDPIELVVLAPHDAGMWLHLTHHSWQGRRHNADPGPHAVGYQEPALTGEVWPSWRRDIHDFFRGRDTWSTWMPGRGWLKIQYGPGGWQWQHVPLFSDPTGWEGLAPTGQQAMLDAQVHAGVCKQ